MKRIVCVLLAVCMLLCLASCGNGGERPGETESTLPTQKLPVETTVPASSQLPEETKSPTQETEPPEKVNAVSTISLEKSLYTYFEWADGYDGTLVRSEHSCVTLGREAAEAFPELAQALDQIAVKQENTMLDEFYQLVSAAREELNRAPADFQTYVSTLDVQVRRADSVVVSLLWDTHSDYGFIRGFRSLHGSSYDTETGEQLALNDVVEVNNDLAEAVYRELSGCVEAEDAPTEDDVENYFANMPYDGFDWTLDYNGVTFYFAPGELWSGGFLTATVPFAQYPALFREKYAQVPAEYSVELPMNTSFFTQLDGDEAMEEVSISAWYDEERGRYVEYGVYGDQDGQYYYEGCFVSAFHPYYVKTTHGSFVYLLCEDFNEGMRQMSLIVLGLAEDGCVYKVGESNLSPVFTSDNTFLIPGNPGKLALVDGDTGLEAVMAVGSDGMPEPKN